MLKKRVTKVLSLGLAAMLMFGTASCGGKGSDDGKGGDEPKKTEEKKETEGKKDTEGEKKPEDDKGKDDAEDKGEVTIEFMLLNNKGASDDDFLPKKIFKEKFNVDAKFILNTREAHMEKLNLAISSNQLPDVICPILDTNAKDIGPKGALIALDEHYDQVPNFEKYIKEKPEIYTACLAADDHIYFLPRFSEVSDFKKVPLIREDLVKEVGKEIPETFDELKDVLVAIKEQHPDISGIVSRDQVNFVNMYAAFYNTDSAIYYNHKTDKWEYGPLYAGFEELIRDMQDMWAAGVVDKDFFTASTEQWEEKMIAGSGVFTIDYGVRATNANNGHKKLNPDDETFNWTLMMPLTTKNMPEKRLNVAQSVGTWTSWGISSDTQYLDRILEIVDFMYTDEAATLFQWGIEGEHYTVENGKKKFMPDIRASYNPEGTIEADNQLGINNNNFMRVTKDDGVSGFEEDVQKMFDRYRKEVELYENNYNVFLTFDEDQQDELNDLSVNLGTIVSENIVNFITGERDLAEFEDFKQELIDNGAQRVEEIYAEAYENYKVKLASVS